MTLPWLAGAWLAVGVLAAVAARSVRFRPLVTLCAPPLFLILSLLTARVGVAPAPLAEADPGLGREAAGLVAAAAAALWVCLLQSEAVDGMEVLAIGAVGGAATLLLGARSPLLFGVAALLGVAALTLRWLTASPGRATLAAGRVAGVGAAALLAASVLLTPVHSRHALASPAAVGGATAGVGLAAGLLAAGVVALTAMVPLGGWAAGAMATLRAPEAGAWLLLLAPALLLSATAIPAELPLAARLPFEHTLLACGLVSAIWAGTQAMRAGAPGPGRRRHRAGGVDSSQPRVSTAALRYRRLAMGDLALVAVAIGTGEGVAGTAALLIILTHLVAGPLLLQPPRRALGAPRRLVWLALSGIPPSPSFWGRFLVLQACAAFSGPVTLACLAAQGVMTIAAILALVRGERAGEEAVALHRLGSAWVIGAASVTLGLVPMVAVHLVFGAGG